MCKDELLNELATLLKFFTAAIMSLPEGNTTRVKLEACRDRYEKMMLDEPESYLGDGNCKANLKALKTINAALASTQNAQAATKLLLGFCQSY